MIKPLLQGDAFLEDVASAETEHNALHLWWLGQSGFLIAWNGKHLLFDPYLSDSLTKKYASTDKPHVRMTERVVDPARLDFVDVVTSSHNHTDHLDAETLVPLMRVNPNLRMVIPKANRAFVAERLGCARDWPVGLDAGEMVEVAGVRIAGVPAAHETIERDPEGRCVYMGYVAEFGPFRVYHSGDTVMYEGMEDILSPFAVDVALVPINGAKPERRVAGNLDGAEAARLAKAIGAGCVIPCHYDMFEFNTAIPDLFERTCREIEQAFTVLRAGERRTIRK